MPNLVVPYATRASIAVRPDGYELPAITHWGRDGGLRLVPGRTRKQRRYSRFNGAGRVSLDTPFSAPNQCTIEWLGRRNVGDAADWRVVAGAVGNVHHAIINSYWRPGYYGSSARSFFYIIPADGLWHRYTIVYDYPNGLMHLYVDGVFVETQTMTAGDPFALAAIARFGNWTGTYELGDAAGIRVWNRMLTAAEIGAVGGVWRLHPNPAHPDILVDLVLSERTPRENSRFARPITNNTPADLLTGLTGGPVAAGPAAFVEDGTSNVLTGSKPTGGGWSAWSSGTVVTGTVDQPDPLGGIRATRIQTTGGTTAQKVRWFQTIAGVVPVAMQWWVRSRSGKVRVEMTLTGGATVSQVLDVADGWVKQQTAGLGSSSAAPQFRLYAVDPATDLDSAVHDIDADVALLQEERKDYVTSWQPNSAARATEALGVSPSPLESYTGDWTVEWVVGGARPVTSFNLIARWSAGGQLYEIVRYGTGHAQAGKAYIQLNGGTSGSLVQTTAALSDDPNRADYYAVVRRGATLYFYVNGSPAGSIAVPTGAASVEPLRAWAAPVVEVERLRARKYGMVDADVAAAWNAGNPALEDTADTVAFLSWDELPISGAGDIASEEELDGRLLSIGRGAPAAGSSADLIDRDLRIVMKGVWADTNRRFGPVLIVGPGTWLYAHWWSDSKTLTLSRRYDGAYGHFDTTTVPSATATGEHTIELRKVGDNLKVFLDGVQRINYTLNATWAARFANAGAGGYSWNYVGGLDPSPQPYEVAAYRADNLPEIAPAAVEMRLTGSGGIASGEVVGYPDLLDHGEFFADAFEGTARPITDEAQWTVDHFGDGLATAAIDGAGRASLFVPGGSGIRLTPVLPSAYRNIDLLVLKRQLGGSARAYEDYVVRSDGAGRQLLVRRRGTGAIEIEETNGATVGILATLPGDSVDEADEWWRIRVAEQRLYFKRWQGALGAEPAAWAASVQTDSAFDGRPHLHFSRAVGGNATIELNEVWISDLHTVSQVGGIASQAAVGGLQQLAARVMAVTAGDSSQPPALAQLAVSLADVGGIVTGEAFDPDLLVPSARLRDVGDIASEEGVWGETRARIGFPPPYDAVTTIGEVMVGG